jgi:predicted dinucleotide-utilizing enzyme
MFFLIEYDRDRGQIVTFRSFDDAERELADRARLEMELDLNRRKVDREVVILEAASEDAVRRTHRRYFENLEELLKAS